MTDPTPDGAKFGVSYFGENEWSLNNVQHHQQIIKLHSSIFQLFHSNLTYPHPKKSTDITLILTIKYGINFHGK